MGRRRAMLLGALVAALVAMVAGVAFAVHRSTPLSSETEAQVRKTILGFELAKASSRPKDMIGKKLSAEDKARLQARFLRRVERFATGPELRRWQSWDYARALLEDEGRRGEFVSCTGRIVYWDFLRRGLDGSIVVRAAVGQHYRIAEWDAAADRVVPKRDWEPCVGVRAYTLKESGGAWKVSATDHWMFYDPATGQLGLAP